MATLYPNPTSNNLTVSFENEAGDLPKDVRAYNEDQKLIFSKSGAEFQKLKDNQFRIDLQNQPPGKILYTPALSGRYNQKTPNHPPKITAS